MLGNNIIVEKPEYVFTLLEKDLSTTKKPCGTILEKTLKYYWKDLTITLTDSNPKKGLVFWD